VNPSADCQTCPAFGPCCQGTSEGAERCREIQPWLDTIDGLDLDMELAPQPEFELPLFFPQLLNGLEVPSVLSREPAVGVGIAKTLTPQGRVSHRAIPQRYGTRSLRYQWGIGEGSLLLCLGNTLDDCLERLWLAHRQENAFGHIQALGFDAATSLNFSIYLDRPRLEHLVNIKRTWLTVRRMQESSSLIPIPHLQWGHPLDLERQIRYAREQGFHTLTVNLQLVKRQGWNVVAAGLPVIREQAPELRLLVTGVASLKRMAELARAFPTASFTNTTCHYLAQRGVRLRRDGTRLIKEPVTGHPDLILAESAALFREFLDDVRHQPSVLPPRPSAPSSADLAAALQTQLGFEPIAARDAVELLAADKAVTNEFERWLRTGHLEREFRGSLGLSPGSDSTRDPTLGDLLNQGADPAEAFLHLAYLASQVHDGISAVAGRAGH
jgi:hypothetical protein